MRITGGIKIMSTHTPALSISEMVLAAIMAAVTCVLGPLSVPIPISPVPLSLTNLVVYLSVCLLGWKLGTISYLVYLAIGLVGLPVFSGFSSGFGKLLGPTGGYLIGMIFMAIIAGLAFEKLNNRFLISLFMIIGSAVNYLFGTSWLCFQAHMTFIQGLWAGVIPYIPGDLAKIILVLLIGPVIRNRLISAGLLEG